MTEIDPGNLPRHIAIIMDGNGRWAKQHAMGRIAGHKKGADAVRDTVRACREIGVRVLTLYAFSTENWLRPAREVKALMGLLEEYLRSEVQEMLENWYSVFNAISKAGTLTTLAWAVAVQP